MEIQDQKDKEKAENLELRSHDVREVMGQAPNWVIRWGITAVLTMVIMIIVGAGLVAYDDVIPARITVTTQNPPAYLTTRASGKITHLLVTAGDEVKKDQVLAVIENHANYEDIAELKALMDGFEPDLKDLSIFRKRFPMTYSLGAVQDAYGRFLNSYQAYLLYESNQPLLLEVNSLNEQIVDESAMLDKQLDQQQVVENQLALSRKAYERNRVLADSGVIATAQFEALSREYLNDQQAFEAIKVQVASTRFNITALRGRLKTVDLDRNEAGITNWQRLAQSVQDLKNALRTWEVSYQIQSPIDGVVSLFDVWSQYQNVQAGDVLFTVVPKEASPLIGHVVMPVTNSGKVKTGQDVIIKIDNYPHQEWGSLKGRVTKISAVPQMGSAEYSIQVSLDGLTTSFKKELEFKQEMQGTAEIVTEKLTVLERVFYQLREVLSRS